MTSTVAGPSAGPSAGPAGGCGRGASATAHSIVRVTPALPAPSIWRTANVCLPMVRPVIVNGELQAANAPPSVEHSNVPVTSPDHASSAVLAVTVPSGPPVSAGAAGA